MQRFLRFILLENLKIVLILNAEKAKKSPSHFSLEYRSFTLSRAHKITITGRNRGESGSNLSSSLKLNRRNWPWSELHALHHLTNDFSPVWLRDSFIIRFAARISRSIEEDYTQVGRWVRPYKCTLHPQHPRRMHLWINELAYCSRALRSHHLCFIRFHDEVQGQRVPFSWHRTR